MFELRSYQKELSNKGLDILHRLKIVYLVMEVRSGKTLTSLNIANLYGAKKVLFITKLMAISSIQNDYNALNPNFEIVIINKESLHKIKDNDFDLLIVDENHAVSSTYPKPNKSAKEIKIRFGNLPQIYLSGTPTVESGSQWFHSFWISNNSPFKVYKNFYAWAREFTTPAIKNFGALKVNDYSKSIDSKILPIVNPYLVKFTQEEAGFISTIKEQILYIDVPDNIKKIVNILLDKLVVEGKNEVILGDTPVKLMTKIHQLENGTIIFESFNKKILSTYKADFIKEYFKGKKMAIFYYFKQEWDLLKEVFKDDLTNNLDEFNSTNKHIALQQQSGSEGVSLKSADVLIYFNFSHSGKLYIQGRDRMTTKTRVENNVYFIIGKGGINEKILKSIRNKKNYNLKIFKKDYIC